VPHAKEAAETPLSPTTKVERRLLVLAGLLIVVLAAGCWVLWTQNRAIYRSLNAAPWQSTPTVASLWSGILGGRPNTDIILADTSFALIEDITKRSIPLSDYLRRDYVSKIQIANLSPDRRVDLAMIMQRNNGSLGDFRAAQHILALNPGGKSFHLYSARDYSPALVKEDNIILIGARKSNPWDDLFAGNMNFSSEYDPSRSLDYIENRTPAPGEQKTYSADPSPSTGGFCVVAYLPNPQQSGKVLLIAGTDSAATEGGGDFLTSEDQLSHFQKMLHLTTLPYFEVVLRTSNLNGTPIDAKIIAYRTYPSSR
jgi:predicted component of type VI protein secretion system